MRPLLRDQVGTATLEYLVVLISFTIVVSLALLTIGPSLVEQFNLRVAWLALPFP